jgi:hypothetical protein
LEPYGAITGASPRFMTKSLFDLADRADPQLLQGLVIELAAVVVAHARTRPDHHRKVNLLLND